MVGFKVCPVVGVARGLLRLEVVLHLQRLLLLHSDVPNSAHTNLLINPPRHMHYGTCAGALRLQGSLVAGADQSLVGDGVGHHALAPHRLEAVQGTGWLSTLLACADQGAVGDCSLPQARWSERSR